MSNQELQKELKEKVKVGIKPSDLKKKTNIPVPPLPLINKPSKEEKKTIKQLQQEIKFWEETARSYLQDLSKTMADLDQAQLVIKVLREKQPEPLNKVAEKALIEANQKIRELQSNLLDLQSKCKELEAKLKERKPKPVTKEQGTQTEFFNCATCQNSFPTQLIRLIDKQNHKHCRDCVSNMLNQANQLSGEQVILRKKQVEKPVNSQIKETNPYDLLTPELWDKYPYAEADEILEKEFGIKLKE